MKLALHAKPGTVLKIENKLYLVVGYHAHHKNR